MKKSKFTGEQIAFALRQAEVGTPVAEVCRKMGVSEATYYRWKQLYGGMGPSELRKMRQLEDENQKLKRLVADLSLDKAMLQEVLSKKSSAWSAAGDRSLGSGSVPCERAARLFCAQVRSPHAPLQVGAARSGATATTHPGDRRDTGALWLSPHSRASAAGGLAGQCQACP